MDQWLQQVEENILERQLLVDDQPVLVAVSGGLDSMVLLHVLRQLAPKHGWKLTVAHFNHQLRGRSSDADEKLVRITCEKCKVLFVAGAADVKGFAIKQKNSIEMAARKLRHGFLARTAQAREISTVALAHHADDQIELFILRWLRGAGGEGLAGMKWMSPSPSDPKINLIRPLLHQAKSDLQSYAQKCKVVFREDASNDSLDMQRNKIRHKLIPLLRKEFQPALAQTLRRTMEIVGAEAELANQLAQDWLDAKRRVHFEKLPVAVQRRMLVLQLRELKISAEFHLVEQLRLTATIPVSYADGLSVFRDVQGSLHCRKPELFDFAAGERKINTSQKCKVVFGRRQFSWEIQETNGDSFSPVPATEFFDADKVGTTITLRHWQPGDRFQPIGMKKPVKLQDLFTNFKVPRAERHGKTVAVAENGQIYWVEGLRISEEFKLDAASQRQLIWSWSDCGCVGVGDQPQQLRGSDALE